MYCDIILIFIRVSMTISELILKLENIKKEFGDLDVIRYTVKEDPIIFLLFDQEFNAKLLIK